MLLWLKLHLCWDPGAGVWQRVWKSDIQLCSVSIVSILLWVEGVRGKVGDCDLQHHQPLVGQGEHLDVIFISASKQVIWLLTHTYIYSMPCRIYPGTKNWFAQVLTLAGGWTGQRSEGVFQTGSSTSGCSGRFCHCRILLSGSSPSRKQMVKSLTFFFGHF